MPINLSNVMIWNPSTKKQDKIAFADDKGKKKEFLDQQVRILGNES